MSALPFVVAVSRLSVSTLIGRPLPDLLWMRRIAGSALLTMTVTAADVVRLPAASRAMAVREWLPLPIEVVSQVTRYGSEVTSAPSGCPSSWNCTPMTPASSLAVALTITLPATAVAVGEVMATVGGVVSGASVVALCESDGADTLPAAVESRHRVCIRRVGLQPVVGIGRRCARRNDDAVAQDAIAGDRDVVAGGGPGERDLVAEMPDAARPVGADGGSVSGTPALSATSTLCVSWADDRMPSDANVPTLLTIRSCT